MKPKKDTSKKNRAEIFTPKKANIDKSELKRVSQKITRGHRFGKKWFPHDK